MIFPRHRSCCAQDVLLAHRVLVRPTLSRRAVAWLGALALLLLVLALAGIWLNQESTLQKAAGWIGERTQGRLVFEDPHGSLLSRATFSRVTWRMETRTVTFDEVGLRWSPW